MPDTPMTTEPAAPSTPGADALVLAQTALALAQELDAQVCALLDRVAELEARIDALVTVGPIFTGGIDRTSAHYWPPRGT